MFEYVSSIAGGALGVASSMLALSGGGTKALSNSSKAMSIHRELFDERSSRHDIDCKIDQLKLLTENGMWMSGFAIACFVELPIPDNADSGFLGFRMMVLFAVAVGITVFLFSTCSFRSTLLIADLCYQRPTELRFRERWTRREEQTYQTCQLAFVLGVVFFFLLSITVTFVTSFNHRGRDMATIISGVIFLVAAGIVAPILWQEFPDDTVEPTRI